MPAAAIIGGIGAVASAGAGIVKSISGAKEAKRSRRAIDAYERTPLENIYQNTQISRLGADLQVEQQAQQGASMIEALRKGGTRGIIGGMGRLAMRENAFNRQVAADLDRQQKELDMLEAGDEARIRGIKEQRDRENLAGLGQRLQTGRAQMWGGIDTAIGGISQIGSSLAGGVGGGGAKGVGATGGTGFTDVFGGAQTYGQAF